MRRTFTLTFLVACLAALALAGLARAAGPAWTVSPNHFPTNVQPGTTMYYSVVASNVGTAASTAGTTATITLPTGITANTATGIGWTCPSPAGQNVITCTGLLPVAAGQTSDPISITATVPADASGALTATASVTGGGFAETAAATDVAQVGDPAHFGIAGFTARAYDDTGHDVTQAGGHPWMATTQISLNTVAPSDGAVAGRQRRGRAEPHGGSAAGVHRQSAGSAAVSDRPSFAQRLHLELPTRQRRRTGGALDGKLRRCPGLGARRHYHGSRLQLGARAWPCG